MFCRNLFLKNENICQCVQGTGPILVTRILGNKGLNTGKNRPKPALGRRKRIQKDIPTLFCVTRKKEVFIKILQSSQENACAEVLEGLRSKSFSCEFYEIFKNIYFMDQLLMVVSLIKVLLNFVFILKVH